MAGTKISALPAAIAVFGNDQFAVAQAGVTKMATASMVRGAIYNASAATVTNSYPSDTYLAGSAITIPTAGGWKVGTTYQCGFDMTKTAAGIAAFTVNVRAGTLGTTGDASLLALTFAAGTAVADAGWFELWLTFRTIGAGTAAIVQAMLQCSHHLAATGLITTGASGTGILVGTSAGFASTTQTIIGLSINGGASFSGTNTLVQAFVLGI